MSPIDLLKGMLEIYSPSGKEEELALFLKDELPNLGFRNVRLDKVGNLYGEIGSGPPAILLCGHMDTVPSQIPLRIEGRRIYGRGAVDAKSSLAAMISAVHNLGLRGIGGKVIVAGVVDEERNARGIRQLLREGTLADYAIFGEPSGSENITFAYRGRLDLRINCRTETGHIGAKHLYDNAVERSYELWGRLRRMLESRKSPHGIFYSVTPCITNIRSQRSMGSIPDECSIRVDVRLPPTVKCAEGTGLAEEAIELFKNENPKVSVDLTVLDMVEPFVADRNTILMKALKESIEEVIRRASKFVRKTGTGDMNIFGGNTGIPVATYGPGDAQLSHTRNEYVEFEEFQACITVYEKTVEKTILEDQTLKSQIASQR
ncbi:MAG: M20/M25/M40 family metallo-hydrolase [Candidatus Bathyarchaeota archaeon]|nr:M20/M25/M40 family metallo-hydrolase [Candidatus Bathyarchaeota archaeon]MDH5688734.1 M20/M25/M40 family metallo-hydrolase [Candidatus Bathyarchaeota archaeon]